MNHWFTIIHRWFSHQQRSELAASSGCWPSLLVMVLSPSASHWVFDGFPMKNTSFSAKVVESTLKIPHCYGFSTDKSGLIGSVNWLWRLWFLQSYNHWIRYGNTLLQRYWPRSTIETTIWRIIRLGKKRVRAINEIYETSSASPKLGGDRGGESHVRLLDTTTSSSCDPS